jgi:hypothetical protein
MFGSPMESARMEPSACAEKGTILAAKMNPYESPSVDVAPSRFDRQRPIAWKTVVFGLGGALIGYIFFTILANLEPWQFYTIRSFVTGKTAMSDITAHPADPWVQLGLFLGFIFGGTYVGFRIARRQRTTLQRDNAANTTSASLADDAHDNAESGGQPEPPMTRFLKS